MVPAKNEVETIGHVLKAIPRMSNCDVIVVDGDSTDGTVEESIKHGVTVIVGKGLGKGFDVRIALELLKPDYLYMLDADGTYDPVNILAMHYLLSRDFCDVMIGSRINRMLEKGAMSYRNIFGNVMLTLLANILYKERTSDLCTGLWGFNRKALDCIKLTADGFDIEANLFTEINRNKLKLRAIPIAYRGRGGTKPKLKMSDGFVIAKRLITERFK